MKGEIFVAQKNSESLRPESVRPSPLVKFNGDKKAGPRRNVGKNSSTAALVSLKLAETAGESKQLPLPKASVGPQVSNVDGNTKQSTVHRDAPSTPPTPPRDSEPMPLSSQSHLASQSFTSDSPSLQLVKPLVSSNKQELSVQSSIVGPQVLDDYCDRLWQSSSAPSLMQQSSVSALSPLGGSQLLDMQSASMPSLTRQGPQLPSPFPSFISSNEESSVLGPSRLGGLQLFDNYCDERGQQHSSAPGTNAFEVSAQFSVCLSWHAWSSASTVKQLCEGRVLHGASAFI
eukprot:TRINITY_DN155_c0_g1_i3.p1 TRINITY_DN155_c0_g1~~TRINITY_DN155_c0_g1_i3.p1  ORF type:complete len:288 (+),score=18.93 TRINITY_DN155_c0_g1_i3:165-1028(+)